MNFDELGLSAPILKAVTEKGYTAPSPIQEKAIPIVLSGRDMMAAAQTGTGKTAGFTLPILELLSKGSKPKNNQVRTLILTPTRELAAQIDDNVKAYGKGLRLSSTVVFGGVKINPQMMRLRRGMDILVATPGRLLDLYQQNAVRFDQLEILVLDEADRMLDMGFIHDIKKVLAALPKNRQNLLFSATFSDEIRRLAKGLVNDPVEISVTPKNSTAKRVEQLVYTVDKSRKTGLLIELINENEWKQVLVFCRTKHGANRLTAQLEKNDISAAAIHGNKSQGARTKALANFKAGQTRILVATDIAARGIDINELPQVVNFDLPNVPEDYVHRIGRTGRAGKAGHAVSLVSAEEDKLLFDIERLIQKHLERREIEGFEPKTKVRPSKELRPVKAKRPKKKDKGRNRDNAEQTTRSRRRKSDVDHGGGENKPARSRRRKADTEHRGNEQHSSKAPRKKPQQSSSQSPHQRRREPAVASGNLQSTQTAGTNPWTKDKVEGDAIPKKKHFKKKKPANQGGAKPAVGGNKPPRRRRRARNPQADS
ncbi:MAG: ATP-dependent RNA helicase RhlE [uncultured Thiotrichaceae bacterium]|uniref:ATP-dependent RNA helicase RhlE n=1 Tax=uncultured Thiotrichaceae bacterium TaxID=298394 RepID=A0A6S6UGX3_9GAMM|nr:MAG: ATP-dependent RNA helicase RhlE [uncultured Thiotrichaceae bacterium]